MTINSSRIAFDLIRKHLIHDTEEVWCLALGPNLRLLDLRMIFRGTVDSCLIHPRDIFRFACLTNASHLILAHNHPSGECKPSKQDLDITYKLLQIGILIEIPIVDHLIISKHTYFSMAESGTLSKLC